MLRSIAAALAVALMAHGSAFAGVVPVVFGTSWDGPTKTLQTIVDARYGTGRVNVVADHMCAHPVDIDPWFWVDDHFTAYMIKEVAGNANRNVLCWYEENGVKPAFPGGGIVFSGPAGAGATTVIAFTRPTRFGFMLEPNGSLGTVNAPPGECFFTNRFYNDLGPNGTGALHAPLDGDVQALVFDVSSCTAPNTWLVCFEDLDSGAMPGAAGSSQTDNDFNDMVFEVTALGATPVRTLSFGALKELYRH
jgi:hypothetical protein